MKNLLLKMLPDLRKATIPRDQIKMTAQLRRASESDTASRMTLLSAAPQFLSSPLKSPKNRSHLP